MHSSSAGFGAKSRSFREWIDSEAFRDVADELSRANHWHGFAQQQEAFKKVGMEKDFHVGTQAVRSSCTEAM
jgi:hypothetical protein